MRKSYLAGILASVKADAEVQIAGPWETRDGELGLTAAPIGMTAADLLAALADMPDDADVVVKGQKINCVLYSEDTGYVILSRDACDMVRPLRPRYRDTYEAWRATAFERFGLEGPFMRIGVHLVAPERPRQEGVEP
jgi:hypothetical protein